MTLDTKIEVSVGCAEWMQKEIESLRSENEKLLIKTELTERFLKLTESISRPVVGYGIGEDRLWQAKKEIHEAKARIERVEKDRPQVQRENKEPNHVEA